MLNLRLTDGTQKKVLEREGDYRVREILRASAYWLQMHILGSPTVPSLFCKSCFSREDPLSSWVIAGRCILPSQPWDPTIEH